jgi:hypothetical protein
MINSFSHQSQPPGLHTPRFSLDVESGFSPQSIEHRPSSINSPSATTIAAIHCASGSTNYDEAIALPGREVEGHLRRAIAWLQ